MTGRPIKKRIVKKVPKVNYFKPQGVQLRNLEIINPTVEEIEAIRLKDMKGHELEKCAKKMKVSRRTFSRVLNSGRKKIADALFHGKAIKIEGGEYMTEKEAKGVPKRDGSGKGIRANRGRGGCKPPQDKGLDVGFGRGCPRRMGRGRGRR